MPYTIDTNPNITIFRAYDIRGIVGESIHPHDYYAIGRAFGQKVLAEGRDEVVVGQDVRLSSPEMFTAMTEGLSEAGVQVIDLGRVPTPILNYATKCIACDGIMITASHNPKEYNGIKLYMSGMPLGEDCIQDIYVTIQNNLFLESIDKKEHRQNTSITERYITEMKERIHIEGKLKVVVDAGNGAAALMVEQLYTALGMEVIPLYCEPDGHFPNHHPNPGDPKNMVDLQKKVVAEGADIGLAFDGDADRLGVVTSAGEIVWPDQIMMFLSKHLLALAPQSKIVFDVKCEDYLADYILDWGGQPIMWQTGHSKIRKKMIQINAALAGEMSGHIFLPYFWYDFDDPFAAGAVLLQILAKSGVSLDELKSFIPQTYSTHEMIVYVDEAKKFDIVESFKANIDYTDVEINTIDGVRIHFNDGWIILRASNTTNALTIRCSAMTEARLNELLMQLRSTLHKIDPAIDF